MSPKGALSSIGSMVDSPAHAAARGDLAQNATAFGYTATWWEMSTGRATVSELKPCGSRKPFSFCDPHLRQRLWAYVEEVDAALTTRSHRRLAETVVHGRRVPARFAKGHAPIPLQLSGQESATPTARATYEFVEAAARGSHLGEPISDKVTSHSYETMYAQFLTPLHASVQASGRRLKLLEIGMGCDMQRGSPGASTLLWTRLLPGAEVWQAELHGDCAKALGASCRCASWWATRPTPPSCENGCRRRAAASMRLSTTAATGTTRSRPRSTSCGRRCCRAASTSSKTCTCRARRPTARAGSQRRRPAALVVGAAAELSADEKGRSHRRQPPRAPRGRRSIRCRRTSLSSSCARRRRHRQAHERRTHGAAGAPEVSRHRRWAAARRGRTEGAHYDRQGLPRRRRGAAGNGGEAALRGGAVGEPGGGEEVARSVVARARARATAAEAATAEARVRAADGHDPPSVDLRSTSYGAHQQRSAHERQQMYASVLKHWRQIKRRCRSCSSRTPETTSRGRTTARRRS